MDLIKFQGGEENTKPLSSPTIDPSSLSKMLPANRFKNNYVRSPLFLYIRVT